MLSATINSVRAHKKNGNDLIASEVRTKLRSMIIAAELKPGQRLVEDELTALLGVGRTPVREALLLLQGEGYISRDRGWVVHEVDRSKVQSIFESRAAIDGAVARLAARRMNLETCERLQSLIDQMEPGPSLKRNDLNQLNILFHQTIMKSADNDLLGDFYERTQFAYWMLRIPIMFSDEQINESNRQHRLIVKALLKRDESAAEEAARYHVEATMKIVIPALQIF